MINVISKKKYCNYIEDAKILYALKKITCEEQNDKFCNEIKKYIIPNLEIDDDFIFTCNTEEESDTPHYNALDLQHSHERISEIVNVSLVPDSSNDGKSTGTIISASSVKRRNINKYEYYRVLFLNEYYSYFFI
ncbi:hypothetical protein PCYB_002760 [Plasmodium cynomolgi strain B]|uniref:CYIR protein n=1 Tax=Plasmodium cynomolgi (strain B) TaxID=1120755 RepID=K6VJF6_PLACD|nr:hypothetical protein PCYB_002760 [Plasmodium cynomolgi strain B]GAB69527.1 hypothetical protein PCYB_002760 [Plasmodium cynomolgi strain B]